MKFYIKWTSSRILLIGIAFTLIACGKVNVDDPTILPTADAEIPAPTPTPSPEEGITLPEECEITSLDSPPDVECEQSRMVYSGDIIADSVEEADAFVMTASKKNGGTNGSVFFRSHLFAEEPHSVSLPNKIPAEGKAGNGGKLYILFNNSVDCAWFAHGNKEYRDPRCFINATRDGGSRSGFTGGTEISNESIDDVFEIHMEINGASGNGVLTTAIATFPFL